MKNIFLFSILFSLFAFSSNSSHYLGNDLRFEQIGANQFVLILRTATAGVYPNTEGVNIYVENTNALSTSVTLSLDSLRTDTLVYGTNTFSLAIAYYSDTVTLSNNTNGYYAVASHCCRGMSLNHAQYNMLYTCDIPNPAIFGGNSNPRFVNYPDSLFMLIGLTRQIDFSANDLDGDSLVYSIINPYDNTSAGGTKPFSLLQYNAGFNLVNPIGPGAMITINSATGIITARPAQIGIYVIAVKCEEFRNGVKIGEVVRDIVIPAINAPIPSTSLDENIKSSEASIFPNPSFGNFSILLSTNDYSTSQLEIFDITGKQVMTGLIMSNKIEINTENWEKGIYFARIFAGDKLITKKVIIQ